MSTDTLLYLSRRDVESHSCNRSWLAGRERADERTICINLGLALDDMATAMLIFKKAQESKIGMQLPL